MYGQQRWTFPLPPSIKLVSTTICKIVMEMCVVVSLQFYAVRTRAMSASAVLSEIPVTPVHTCSDLSVLYVS